MVSSAHTLALIDSFLYQSLQRLHMDPTCAFMQNFNQPQPLFAIQNIWSSKTPEIQAGKFVGFTLKITYCITTVQQTKTPTFFFLHRFCIFF